MHDGDLVSGCWWSSRDGLPRGGCVPCHRLHHGWPCPLVSSQWAELLFIYLLRFYLILHAQEGHLTRWHLGTRMDATLGCLGGASSTLNPSCAVLKGNRKTCRRCVLHPTASEHTLTLACVLVVSCIYLLLLPVTLSSVVKRTPLPLHGNHVLAWCHVYISKLKFETWPNEIWDTFKVFS